jgi:cyclase
MHLPSRRGFLTRTLGAGWLGASLLDQAVLRAAHARAQVPEAPRDLFEIEKVAEGVYAAVAKPVAMINCNAAIFELTGGLLIVDAHSKPSAAAALAAQLRNFSQKPVRYVVNTHFHFDHTGGNPAYRKIAPQADIISSAATRELTADFAANGFKGLLEMVAKSIDDAQAKLAAAKTPREKKHFEQSIREGRAFLAEMRNTPVEPPDITFENNLVIHDPAGDLHLAFRGRGHTRGDIVVFSPAKKVLASGDLLHGWLPYPGDGYPLEWPRTLRLLAEFPFEQVIGGHGGVQHTRERLPQMAAYIEELTAAVADGRRKGRTVAELQAAIVPATLKSLEAGGYGGYVTAETMKYSFDAALGTPAEVLEGGVRANVAATYRALERAERA